jgi:amino acid adenylation domain-containing protein
VGQLNKNIEDIYPLTPMQHGMLFHDLLSSGPQRPYIQQVLWRMNESVALPDLQRAWQHVTARHPILRTFVIWEDRDEPIQIVCRATTLPWREVDWSNVAYDAIEMALEEHLAADRAEGFVLTRAPLMRLCAVRLPTGAVQMIWTFHHLLIDGWSLSLILAEVLTAYDALRQGLLPPVAPAAPFRSFVDRMACRDEAKDRAFWTKLLAGFAGPTPLPGNQHAGTDIIRRTTIRRLSHADTEALNVACARHKVTAGIFVQVAWAVLLSAFAREPDVVFGLTVAGRPPELPDAERIAGLFINSVPVRLRIDAAASILNLLHAAMDQQAAREEHLHAPLAHIKSCARITGDATLFDSLVVLENYPVDRVVAETGGRLGIFDARAIDATSFALTLIATPGETLELKLLHDAAGLSVPEADRLVRSLTCLLSSMTVDCTRKVSELPLVDAHERAWLLAAGQGSVREWRRSELLHDLVEEQAARSPDAIAVRFAGADLTFRELVMRTNQLAHRLRRLGVGPDRIVGIAMHRSFEMVVGLLGILKAGGAYLPIDPSSPAERLAFMIADADVSVLLTHSPVVGRLPSHGAQTVCLDADWTAIDDESASPPQGIEVGPDHLAYVIYTSGSTGLPKGAMNTHRAICNRLLWMQEAFGLTPADRVLQKTSCSFDVSVWEFFWPLLCGARLVVAEPGGHHDPAYLSQLINEEKITTVHFVPSMLQLFLEQDGLRSSCASLRRTICSGEAITPALVNAFFGALPGELHNAYGPAEAAVDVTFWQCQPDADPTRVPIGRPIANVCIYVVDGCGRFVPRGMPGELHIGGVGVGRGYHNRPELTAEKFIVASLPGMSHARLYRTGDLARWREDGALEFLGRWDNQIKLRGMRIELGEIEAALLAAPGVKEAAALLERGAAGQDQIVAYVTTTDEWPAESGDLLDAVRSRLPTYMVPSRLVRVDRLPLSPNGKLDRKVLAALVPAGPAASPAASPRSELECAIAHVWQDVLRVDSIGLKDNFFELGGTSLLMIPVHARLRDRWDSTLDLVDMFQHPTVEALVHRITRAAAPVAPRIQHAIRTERIRRQSGVGTRRRTVVRGEQPG